MKRYIKIAYNKLITDIFSEYQKEKFDGTEIFLDEVTEQSVWINGKVIFDEYGDPLFKWINNQTVETTEGVFLQKYKDAKYQEINNAFDNTFSSGVMDSVVAGIKIDVRRSATKNDLQNASGLIKKMDREGWTSIEYVGYNSTAVLTRSQMDELVAEMEDWGFDAYQYKWQLWYQVSTAKTIEEVKAIIWNF